MLDTIEDYFILLIWILHLLKFESSKIVSTNRKTAIQKLSQFIDEQ